MPDDGVIKGTIFGKEFRYTALLGRPYTLFKLRLPDGKPAELRACGHLSYPDLNDVIQV